jgi:hypothetical protein
MRTALCMFTLFALCGCRAILPVGLAASGLAMNVALHEVRYPPETPFGVHTASYIGLPSHPTRAGGASSGMPYNEDDAEDALHSVSLVDCARPRARRGHAFVRAAFNPSGTVSQVTIDAPFELHDDQVRCLVDAFGGATVSRYEGDIHIARISFALP